jgi:hypothetical protein
MSLARGSSKSLRVTKILIRANDKRLGLTNGQVMIISGIVSGGLEYTTA